MKILSHKTFLSTVYSNEQAKKFSSRYLLFFYLQNIKNIDKKFSNMFSVRCLADCYKKSLREKKKCFASLNQKKKLFQVLKALQSRYGYGGIEADDI